LQYFFIFAKVHIIKEDLNFPFYLAKRITSSGKRTFSKLIVGVAIGTIAIGLCAMILTWAVLNGFKGEVTSKQRGFFGDLLVSKNDFNTSHEYNPLELNSTQLEQLRQIDGVKTVQAFATKMGIMNVQNEVEGVVLKGIDQHYDQSYLQGALKSGDILDFKDSTAVLNQVLISQVTADRLQLSVGDDFIMYFVQEPRRMRKLLIKGIYHTGSVEMDQLYVIGSMEVIRRLNGWDPQQVGGYEIQIKDFDKLLDVQKSIDKQLPVEIRSTNIKQSMPEVFQWLDLLDANPQVIFALMMVVAVINMISALLILILERTTMIGLLKAMGLSNGRLRQVFLYQAIYLLGWGLVIGNALAFTLYGLQRKTHFMQLDEEAYYVSYVPLQIGYEEVLILNGALIGLTLLVVFVPTYLIGRIQPIQAIQFK
jgi:lipoprotein-releasing system permease protein